MNRIIASVAAAVLLAGCTGVTVPQTTAQAADQISSAYDQVKYAAAVYTALPFCQPNVPAACSQPGLVAQINMTIAQNDPVITAAIALAKAGTATPQQIEAALVTVTALGIQVASIAAAKH